MSEINKKNFVSSVKRLQYFFNNMKDTDIDRVDQLAQIQSTVVMPEDYESAEAMAKWMEEATTGIAEAKRFINLIDS